MQHPYQPEQITEFQSLFANAMNQPWGLIIFCFVFYFITGYLLYASLFAAIGSAVDNETETQQFMLPVTIPIILGADSGHGNNAEPRELHLILVLHDSSHLSYRDGGPYSV
ncbi:MAG: ABC transporter permease [Marinilabiliales bacterium]|nr:ABC transporter permease [Marinilabiliales bacterium]